jgi:transcriptional regulator with XRE-family HTH domain
MTQSSNPNLNYTIAQKIKQLREGNNVTLEIFYFDTGIHIARIEQGKTNITVSTLHRICEYFNSSLEEFFKDFDKTIS